MKNTLLAILVCLSSSYVFSQESNPNLQAEIDAIEKTFTYQHGKITLKNGVGHLNLPTGFKYLDEEQSERVLVDLWGNPEGENITLGMILPESKGVLSDSSYVFNIQYDEIGYVKDNDADDIDYDELLKQMKKDANAENAEREKMGYEAIHMVGWAAKPYYDKDKKVLHWAKEIKFGEEEGNTLNYNIRILGRKGVLVLNAIAPMSGLPMVQQDAPQVLEMASFGEGLAYKDFNSTTDDVAAWTIGGLVAGKLLAKAGFFAVLLKFWKIIAVGVVALGGGLWKRLRRKKEEPAVEPIQQPDNNA